VKYLIGSGLLLCVALPHPARADLVLLDEYWSPEIAGNDVVVAEVDTQETGDPTEAKFGECSAKLWNESGSPNVRFRGAAPMTLSQIPPGDCELSLWYRTNGWTGPWRVEVWVWHEALHNAPAPAPVRVLQTTLDGGGPDGQLLADDQWHEARGRLTAGESYEATPKEEHMGAAYVWLVPVGGWNVAHRTYIDRISIEVVDGDRKGEPAPAPARRIRPKPGAQTDGPGWIWWEGEDAFEHNVPTGGATVPMTEAQQALLSGNAWLSHHGVEDLQVQWEITVPEDGRYTLWCRGQGAPFRWCWDDGTWSECGFEAVWTDHVPYQDHGAYGWLRLCWVCLGEVQMSRGRHVLAVGGVPDDQAVGFDCWLVTRGGFMPDGARRPADE